MPFPLNLLAPRNSQLPLRNPSPGVDGYDSSSSTDSTETAKSAFHNSREHRAHRSSYVVSSSTSLHTHSGSFMGTPEFILHPPMDAGRSSLSSTATSTPIPSRAPSPLPQFYTSSPSSTYTSDADSEPTSPLLARNRRNRWWIDDGRRWWTTGRDGRRRRRRREHCLGLRSMRRMVRMILRHPLFPTQPTSILLTLLVLTLFAILLTLVLIHVLNPDKEPLPWRVYCSIPSVSTSPPFAGAASLSPSYPFNSLTPSDMSSISSLIPPPFPPPYLDDLPPAGVFLGVFSMDSDVERRMLVRTTWASHSRSRNGAGAGDSGLGTSKTLVRFVLGRPRKHWERRILLEAETYNDMIILPVTENMNSGKTHAFFTWASTEAWVPPSPTNLTFRAPAPNFSYSNTTARVPIPLAKHDPLSVRQEWLQTGKQAPWVRPDFVVKVDDDSFVMLAELESRLRLELYKRSRHLDDSLHARDATSEGVEESGTITGAPANATASESVHSRAPPPMRELVPQPSPLKDPLVYWGYLVKNQFMAGELYALSWSIVEWVAHDPTVKTMVRGKEDKQVAKWMRLHPRAQEVHWQSERCWIYDHPRAGTVYAHGFLFPSEVSRVKQGIMSYLTSPFDAEPPTPSSPSMSAPTNEGSSPTAWAYSSVATFGVPYSPPLPDLSTPHSVEALVEGSELSKLREGNEGTAVEAWIQREGHRRRYEEKRVGGTVVVHFIKKNPWFLETALALLEGDEFTEREIHRRSVKTPLVDSVPVQHDHSTVSEPTTIARPSTVHSRR